MLQRSTVQCCGLHVPCSSALADVVPSRAGACAVASDMAAMEEVAVAVAVAVAVWSGVGRRCSAGGSRVGTDTGAGAAESRSFYTRIALCGSLVRLQMNVGLVDDVGVAVGGWRVQTSMYHVPRIAMLQRPARQLQGARNDSHVIIAAEA